MSQEVERDLHIRIETIISRSRHAEEAFLVDGKTASANIIEMLKKEGHLVKEASVFEVSY